MYPATEFESVPYVNCQKFAQTLRSNDSEIGSAAEIRLPYRFRSNARQPISRSSWQSTTDKFDANAVGPKKPGRFIPSKDALIYSPDDAS